MTRSSGDVLKKLLQCLVMNSTVRVAIAFARYFTPSIKNSEHTLRGCVDDQDFFMSGPQQTRTADFSNDLRTSSSKKLLSNLLSIIGLMRRWLRLSVTKQNI